MSVFGSTFTYAFTYAVCSLYGIPRMSPWFLSPQNLHPLLLCLGLFAIEFARLSTAHISEVVPRVVSRVVSRCLSADLLAVLVVVGRFLIANGKALEEEETLNIKKLQRNHSTNSTDADLQGINSPALAARPARGQGSDTCTYKSNLAWPQIQSRVHDISSYAYATWFQHAADCSSIYEDAIPPF